MKERLEKKEEFENISVNLSKVNIAWLHKVNEKQDRKSLSNTLNYMLNNLRERRNMGMLYDA